MPELQLLRPDHEQPVLDFEIANRAYFTASISDRGDEFFERYPSRHRELLDKQQSGRGAYYVLVAEDGSVLGRFNLTFVDDGVAELGYRVAQRVTGQGLATTAVRDMCVLAASRHGVTTLRAATSTANVASQKVLQKAGFTRVGPAEPSDIGGKEGSWYERDLADTSAPDDDESPAHIT